MRKRTLLTSLVCSVLTPLSAVTGELDRAPLVVHEWGTFTVVQDDLGRPVDGVNINEESLPPFVHKLAASLAPDSHELGPLIHLAQRYQPRRSKGIQRYYHAARMRMETPIIYLYPPPNQPALPIQVDVGFNGGWITEWYPQATVAAPGYQEFNSNVMLNLTSDTTGTITWRDLVMGKEPTAVPPTDYPVWLAPRQTSAPIVSTPDGESEHYLFYRGVANLEAPLRVLRREQQLSVWPNPNSACPLDGYDHVLLWLVDVSHEGHLRFRRVTTNPKPAADRGPFATTSASLNEDAIDGLAGLRKEMIDALVGVGLYQDEAEAMLNTWEASYFRTPGLRLFFTLPQSWTDRVLPLQLSGYEQTDVVRAMIGRIELISDEQRELLNRIAEGPVSDANWFVKWRTAHPNDGEQLVNKLVTGQTTLDELGLNPPADYRAYMGLGRFRDALIHHKYRHPVQRASDRDSVEVSGPLIRIRPRDAGGEAIKSLRIELPGENRIINLGELEILHQGRNVALQANLTQSSVFQGKYPAANLIDGNRESLAHTNTETNPWILVELERPMRIDEVRIWNRYGFVGALADRFDGARVTFHDDQGDVLASVEVRSIGPRNLAAFAHVYDLPRR